MLIQLLPYGVIVLPPNGSHWQVHLLHSGSWFASPAKGSYQAALQMRSVMSSIVGPWNGVSCSGPIRATLPTDVVTVSMYVMSVTLSLMMKIILIVTTLGADITPTANGLGLPHGPFLMTHPSLNMPLLPESQKSVLLVG